MNVYLSYETIDVNQKNGVQNFLGLPIRNPTPAGLKQIKKYCNNKQINAILNIGKFNIALSRLDVVWYPNGSYASRMIQLLMVVNEIFIYFECFSIFYEWSLL